jgi:cytochrome bd-type quinol oxidase subunit 2
VSGILILKMLFSVFLLNLGIRYGLKYIELAFEIVPQDQLRSHFRQAWISSFWILVSLFALWVMWFPTMLQPDFFSAPLPTLVVAIIASIILATALANSANNASESIHFWQKVITRLSGEKHRDEKNDR